MAEILIATYPLAGHTLPLRPIARALVARGHSVRWYAGPRFAATVADTGAEYVLMDTDLHRDDRPMDEVYPDRAALSGLAKLKWDLKHGFIEPAVEQVEGLRRVVAERPADVLISDPGMNGTPMFAELTGQRWVSVGVTPLPLPSPDVPPFGLGLPPATSAAGRLKYRLLRTFLDSVVMRDVVRFRDRIRAQVGLPPSRISLMASFFSPYLHLQAGVPELEYPRRDLPDHVHFVGALTDPAGSVKTPDWWAELEQADRPIVHVTQGTVANGDLDELLLPTVRALADDDVVVVATLGKADASFDAPLPANARVAPYLPYDELLPRTAVMVTNGGYGGVQQALSYGVPLVIAGTTEDKPEVAARVEWAGVGVNLRSNRPSSDAIRAAVRAVLDKPAYRVAAQRLGRQYAALDAGVVSAELIERLLR
jgi:UDP:flavonoid glycosyltransferase YjiC (YdhE family)